MKMDPATLSLVVLALVNLCGLVWGAATVSSSVKRLTTWADRVDHKVNGHDTRIAVLEDRAGVSR